MDSLWIYYGDVFQFLPLAYLVFYAYYKNHSGDALSLAVCALILKGLVTLLKWTIPSARPMPFEFMMDGFPSGHTALAFIAVGFATAFFYRYPQKTSSLQITIISSLAILVGLSRYMAHKHYPLDILVGAALGFSIGVFSGFLTKVLKRGPV